MQRTEVIRKFAVRSIVPVVVLAVAIGIAVQWSVENALVGQWTQARSVAWDALVVPSLEGVDLSSGLGPADKAALDDLFAKRLRPAGVLNLKVFDAEGDLVYSADGRGVGSARAGNDAVRGALAGRVVGKVTGGSERDQESAVAVRLFGRLIGVYSPLRTGRDGGISGVVEVDTSYGPVAEAVRSTALALWTVAAAGLGILYLSQVGIVRQLESRVVASESEVEAVNERLAASMANLEEYSMGTLQALISAVDTKDSYTARHSLGVTDYAVSVGRTMGLSEDDLRDLERACLLHDIGKIGVSEKVLLKPARLNDHELEQIKEHSDMGARIIGSIPFLRDLVPIVLYHHERWDGRGYPEGLTAHDIPPLARVIGVADAFDAMTTDRPYRPAMRVTAAREELVRCRGAQFDPDVVDAFVRALDAGEITPALYHPARESGGGEARAG